ncbi:MAG: hypothetical protein R2851_28040 [Caldilineaceae bacterium]
MDRYPCPAVGRLWLTALLVAGALLVLLSGWNVGSWLRGVNGGGGKIKTGVKIGWSTGRGVIVQGRHPIFTVNLVLHVCAQPVLPCAAASSVSETSDAGVQFVTVRGVSTAGVNGRGMGRRRGW